MILHVFNILAVEFYNFDTGLLAKCAVREKKECCYIGLKCADNCKVVILFHAILHAVITQSLCL